MKNSTIIHIPHASVAIPIQYRKSFIRGKLSHEVHVMTDWFCDALFACGREQIVFPVNRLVCDVERFRDDRLETMSLIGMGTIYQNCSDLSSLRDVSAEEKSQILRDYYDAHHKLFADAVSERLERYGKCLIIDGHSFHPVPLPYESDRTKERPDFCIGTDEYHTPEEVTQTLCDLLRFKGYTVKINTTFAGTIVPMKYYMNDARVVSVMIEVNRSLYMDTPGIKNASFCQINTVLRECICAAEQIMQR